MIMAAAAAKNMQPAAFMQGQNQSTVTEKSGVGSAQGSGFGQQWPAADLQGLGGLMSKPAAQNGGSSFSKVRETITLLLWAWHSFLMRRVLLLYSLTTLTIFCYHYMTIKTCL